MQISQILTVIAFVAAGVTAAPTAEANRDNRQPSRPVISQVQSCPQGFVASCCNSKLSLISANCGQIIVVVGNNNQINDYGTCTDDQTQACCNFLTGQCN